MNGDKYPSVSTGTPGNTSKIRLDLFTQLCKGASRDLFYLCKVNSETARPTRSGLLHPRKLKVEFYDTDGIRHSITIDGPASREKVARILDMVEMISANPLPSLAALRASTNKLDRLTSTILIHLNDKTFSSTDAKKTFETAYNEKIPLSTVSTYLSRLVDRGFLQKHPDPSGLRYMVTPGPQQPLHGAVPSSPRAFGS